MDEIALLQQQLAAVQQQEIALKLSDHNVIDLLQKLQQLGKLQIVHTRTGKQILTPLQVQREVADYVALHGGRLDFSELEKLIDVDRTHVVTQAAVLCRSSRTHKDTYHVVNNGEELLTSWYLDGIMEDTNVLLQESGTASIGELAQQFGFAVDYMRDVVRSRLGGILKAREKDNVLYTDSYVTAQKARLRGVFTAITRPVFVPDVLRSFSIDESVAIEALTELIQTKVLMGTLRSREYVPYVFMAAQRNSVYSFFQQNGYLQHTRARELQVSRPYEFIKKRFPDAVPLQESVISRELQLQLEGAVEAAINDNTFVDVRLVLPSALSAGDVSLLLGMLLTPEKVGHVNQAVQISETFAVSSGLFASCITKLSEDAAIKASHVAAQQKNNAVPTSKRAIRQDEDGDDDDDSDDEAVGSKRGQKGKRGKGCAKRNQEESIGRNVKTKSKKGKREPKRGQSAGDGDGDGDENGPASSCVSIIPSHEETIELLVKYIPALEDCEHDGSFLDDVVAYLKPKMDEIYSAALTKAMSSIIRGDAASLRELHKTFEDLFDEQLAELLVLVKGFNKLSMFVDAKNVADMKQLYLVETHLLKSSATKLAALATSFVAESNNFELEGVPLLSSFKCSEEKDKTIMFLSEENKKILETNLSQSTASSLVRLWTLATAGRRSISDFMAHIPVLAEAFSMPLRKMDRKKERQVIFSYRQTTLAELDDQAASTVGSERQYALLASLILQLLFQQLTGLPSSFPRDTISYGGMVLKALTDIVPEKAMSIIQDLVNIADAVMSGEESAQEQKSNWSKRLASARAVVLLKDLNSAE